MLFKFNIPQIMTAMLCALCLLLPLHTEAKTETQQKQDSPLEFLFPVNPLNQLNDVQTRTNWHTSNDGWIKEKLTQYDFWLGNTPKVAWLKINPNHRIADHQGSYLIELASSGLSRAQLFYQINGVWHSLNSDQALQKAHQGQLEPGIIFGRFITFEINQKWQASELYIRVEATHKLHLQVNIAPTSQHLADNLTTEAFFFFCYGILFVMALYNLVIGRYLRDKLYYFYSLVILVTLIYQIFAHGHGRLISHFNWDQVNYILNFCAMLSAFTALVFLYYFANFKQFTPKLAYYFRLTLIFFGAATLMTLLVSTNAGLNIALLVAGPAPIIVMLATLWAWYRGSKTAGVFVFAWSFYILGGFLWVLYWMGLVTLSHWVELPLVAGAALESILLSLALGYRIQLMQEQRHTLKKSEKYYKEISALDPMTKLANRRAFDQQLDILLNENVSFSLVLFDIDYFKTYNDSHGHLAGDKVIKKLGEILQQAIRSDDMAARIGGEEFALIISNQNINTTRSIAERIRIIFSETAFCFDQQEVYSSVSVGITMVKKNDTAESLIERADKALYRAKDKGRNQTQISVGASS
jgi:two-component system, sensor histidine kinase LadS